MLNFVYLPTKKQLIIVAKWGINQQTLRIFTLELFCSIQKYLQSFSTDLIFCHFNPHLYANGFEKLLFYQKQSKYPTLIRQSQFFWELCSILKLIILPLLSAKLHCKGRKSNIKLNG